MWKYILVFIFISNQYVFSQSIDSISVKDVLGNNFNLSHFQGKKILVVILPTTRSSRDSSFLIRIDSISNAHVGEMITIAMPSYEDGYSKDSVNLMVWYRAILTNSFITVPVYTRKSSGINQNKFLQWLNQSNKNGRIDFELTGPGTMYFLNNAGILIGAFGSEADFSNKVINRMLL